MPSETKPAFGQVWEWVGTAMMLIYPGNEPGMWNTICLDQSGYMGEWSGLHDDPERRLGSWELLSEEDK